MSRPEMKLRPGPAQAPGFLPYGFAHQAYAGDDVVLIQHAQAGRWQAFAELATRYDRSILALALRVTGSEREALKLFQRALITAYRELPSYHFQCSFYIWIHRLVAKSCLEFLEDRAATSTPATGFDLAIEQLSPRERMVVELKHCFGLKLETIASILTIQESAARNALVRATVALHASSLP
jgi:DNA-directed RNA polymerase specialized sigma subunit, sigma24 homolog